MITKEQKLTLENLAEDIAKIAECPKHTWYALENGYPIKPIEVTRVGLHKWIEIGFDKWLLAIERTGLVLERFAKRKEYKVHHPQNAQEVMDILAKEWKER